MVLSNVFNKHSLLCSYDCFGLYCWLVLFALIFQIVYSQISFFVSGREVAAPDGMSCTFNRTLAQSNPDQYPFCYNWMAPVLLGIFMLITNILLLNLLIAIFRLVSE